MKAGYVYFFKECATGAVKIGFTTNIKTRIDCALTYNPNILYFKAYSGSPELEKILHQQFKKNRLRREWFRMTNSDLLCAESVILEWQSRHIIKAAAKPSIKSVDIFSINKKVTWVNVDDLFPFQDWGGAVRQLSFLTSYLEKKKRSEQSEAYLRLSKTVNG